MDIKSSLQVLRDESWASWLFRGFSALTTFLFLFEYGEAFLGSLLLRVSVLFPNVDYFYFDLFGRAFAGMMGVLFIEWAMLQWRGRQLNSAQNENQAGIAANMDKRLGTAAWIMSCVYLVLSLIGYFFGNDPIFTDVTKWVGVMGVITVIGAAAMNFIEDQAYERNSPDFTERLAYRKYQNKIRADAAARAQAQVDSQRHTLIQAGADHKEREMVDDTMRHLTGAHELPAQPRTPRPLPTGQPLRANNAPRQGNGVPDYQDTITVPPPQRMASESPNADRPELRRANQPGE